MVEEGACPEESRGQGGRGDDTHRRTDTYTHHFYVERGPGSGEEGGAVCVEGEACVFCRQRHSDVAGRHSQNPAILLNLV